MKDQIDLLSFLYHRFVFKWQKSFTLNSLPCLPDLSVIGDFVTLSGETLTIKSGKKLIDWHKTQNQQIASDWSCSIGVKNH